MTWEKDLIGLTAGDNRIAATHAIWTLEGLDLLKQNGPALDAVRKALDSSSPLAVRLRPAGSDRSRSRRHRRFAEILSGLQSPRERLFALLAATEAPSNEAIGVAIANALKSDGEKADESLRDAFRLAAQHHAIPFLTQLTKELETRRCRSGTTELAEWQFG